MKLTIQQVMDSTLLISAIIRDARPMPQKGKYRLARMHAKLLPEFTTINAQRDEMIKAYGVHQTIKNKDPETGAETDVESPEFMVPADKMPEFTAAWKTLASETLDIDVEAIPLDQLDLGNVDGSIEASELIVLADLVKE